MFIFTESTYDIHMNIQNYRFKYLMERNNSKELE